MLAVWQNGVRGVTTIDQKLTVPVSSAALSTTKSFHVPLTGAPSRLASRCSGLNVPVKGAVPSTIDVVASSSKTVLV
jgi:hypothetical protein